MQDAGGVQRLERAQNIQTDADGVGQRQATSGEAIGQRLAFEQLHRDEQHVVLFPDLIELTDVGVADSRGGARFLPESLPRGLPSSSRRMILIAAGRSRRSSCAANTVPMPPSPSRRMMR
jgi:hypothetical protein